MTLSDAAITAGLKPTSGSTVSLWESGQRPIKVIQLTRLAKRYGVPVSMFTDPPITDDERLDAAIADAAALEREDWEREQEPSRPGGGGQGVPPRTH